MNIVEGQEGKFDIQHHKNQEGNNQPLAYNIRDLLSFRNGPTKSIFNHEEAYNINRTNNRKAILLECTLSVQNTPGNQGMPCISRWSNSSGTSSFDLI